MVIDESIHLHAEFADRRQLKRSRIKNCFECAPTVSYDLLPIAIGEVCSCFPNFLHRFWQPFGSNSIRDAHFDEFEPPIAKLRKKLFNPLRFGDCEVYRLNSRGLESLHTSPTRDVNREKRSKV